MAEPRRYAAEARSTELTGRIDLAARHHRVVIDGPPWNGFPGEELMPGEVFLGGVASCAVELLQMFARDEGLPLRAVHVEIGAELDPEDQPHPKHTLFNRVWMRVRTTGLDQVRSEQLVERFKGR